MGRGKGGYRERRKREGGGDRERSTKEGDREKRMFAGGLGGAGERNTATEIDRLRDLTPRGFWKRSERRRQSTFDDS